MPSATELFDSKSFCIRDMSGGPSAAALLERFLRGALGQRGAVPLHAPAFGDRAWLYVKDCLDSTWVSSVGGYVDRFEALVAGLAGRARAVATVNGTAGLHLALHGLGVGPGDLVVCPALTFVATANAIVHVGAAPLFLDVEPDSLGLDPDRLRAFLKSACRPDRSAVIHKASGQRIAAVVAVDLYGQPCRGPELAAVAAEFSLPLVEDAAEALGSRLDGRPAGSFGHVAVFSFNGNKILTTGGGGAIVTDDVAIAERFRHLSTTARTGGGLDWNYDAVGYNYRLPNLNAALGVAELERFADILRAKRALAAAYGELFAGAGDARFRSDRFGAESNGWLNTLAFAGSAERDSFLERTCAAGLTTRPGFKALTRVDAYRDAWRDGPLTVAEWASGALAHVPSGVALGWALPGGGA